MVQDGSSRFTTTHWSLIAALPGQPDERDAKRAHEALIHLCEAYWRPLYAFARSRGYAVQDAQDITQAFLAKIIETDGLGDADPDRGRFRSYLLGAMKHFMSNERSRALARKRGGGHRFIHGDIADVEARIATHRDADSPTDADRNFDRDWARETTGAAIGQLADEWAQRGRADQFEVLRPALTGEGASRTDFASRLDMTENAVGVAIHRLRQRYATLIREAVAKTVAHDEDIENEMRYLISVLREN